MIMVREKDILSTTPLNETQCISEEHHVGPKEGFSESTPNDAAHSSEPDEDHQRYSLNAMCSDRLLGNQGVDVVRAQAEFAELSREFSNISQHNRESSRTSNHKSDANLQDIEKEAASSAEDDERFNLEETLRGHRQLDIETGIKSKEIGVLWENLTASGLGGTKSFVKTFPDSFGSFFNLFGLFKRLFGRGKKCAEFDILRNFKGVARPGEMVLVLGKPSSGCTTFLKVISNQRFGYAKVDGEVLYGPFEAKTFAKRYRGEALYSSEEEFQ